MIMILVSTKINIETSFDDNIYIIMIYDIGIYHDKYRNIIMMIIYITMINI